ncbi:hypothetical protein ACFC0N_30360 [Streptomyces zaomyceticus]|uniref:hypothetical protein n=1 Tax=Streptomyces zaomyceticus TaxID=68286 RepID=UPI0035D6B163
MDLTRAGAGLYARSVCEFLQAHGLLVISSELHRDRDQAWVERTIAGLPDRLANEVEAWVKVLRGEGPRRHPARSYRCIRTTLSTLLSTLATWADNGVVSLREVTEEDVTQAGSAAEPAAASSTVHCASCSGH